MAMAQQNSGIARVFGVMQELHQLRGKVCALSEKNRELAKALTTSKQELTKARTTQNAVFSDKVVEWMEARRQPVEVHHRAVQCSFEELDRGLEENTHPEPDPPLSPGRRRDPEPDVTNAIGARTLSVVIKTEKEEVAVESEPVMFQDNETTSMLSRSNAALERKVDPHQLILPPRIDPGSERTSSQRRLRQRDAGISYAEPKLNTKLRRGDYYGLAKRRAPRHNMKSEPRRATSPRAPSPFGQQRSPFRRRTSRHVKRVSYAEPKLNTKLRQGDKFTFTT